MNLEKLDPTSIFIILFAHAIVIACLTAYAAGKRGRSKAFWFISGFLFPIPAPIVLFLLPSAEQSTTSSTIKGATSQSTNPAPPTQLPHESLASLPSAMAQPSEDRLWYYLDQSHKQFGPVSIIALRELWNTGRLELTSYVWTEGMDQWKKVDDMPELKKALSHPNPL